MQWDWNPPWKQNVIAIAIVSDNVYRAGDAENARLETPGPLQMQAWKMQDWKTEEQIAGMENARLKNMGMACIWI